MVQIRMITEIYTTSETLTKKNVVLFKRSQILTSGSPKGRDPGIWSHDVNTNPPG